VKNTVPLKVILTLTIPLLFFIGCEDKPLPFEPNNEITVKESLGKREFEDHKFFNNQKAKIFADKFMAQAQAKIDKANEKYTKALAKVDASELLDVWDKIGEAEDKLVEAQDAYNPPDPADPDYGAAIDLAKKAKELASEALDMLEVILDAVDDD
jgi:hypothetical protein